eukprot:1313118-Pleurochrysis_carterae.AAC.4
MITLNELRDDSVYACNVATIEAITPRFKPQSSSIIKITKWISIFLILPKRRRTIGNYNALASAARGAE